MTETEASTHLLNYADKKERGMNSRQYRTKNPAVNGSNFNSAGGVIQFEIQGNTLNTFCDFQNSYVIMEVENKTLATFVVDNRNGIQNLVAKVECLTAGQTLFSIDRYNVLSSMLMSSDTNSNFEQNTGKVLFGCSDSIGIDGKKTYCVPLMLNGLYNSSKYIPLFSRDKMTIRITLESALTAVVGAGTLPTGIVVNRPELVLHNIELSPDAFSAVYDSVDGVFDIVPGSREHSAVLEASWHALHAT